MDTSTMMGFILAAAATTFFLVVVTEALRYRLGVILATFIESFRTAIIVSVVLTPWTGPLSEEAVIRIGAAFVTPMTMLGLFVIYMPFYYVIATSLSVQTVVALARMPGGAIALSWMPAGSPSCLTCVSSQWPGPEQSNEIAIATKSPPRVGERRAHLGPFVNSGGLDPEANPTTRHTSDTPEFARQYDGRTIMPVWILVTSSTS